MIISKIAPINFQRRREQAPLNYSSQPLYSQSNILKSQCLLKPQNNNLSFKAVFMPVSYSKFAAIETKAKWQQIISRETVLYTKDNISRSEFARDYDRILHSRAYGRLDGKTQVFTNPESTDSSKRIHHVNQVASIAKDLSNFFKLNTELTMAIAIGHDIGHTPFGHNGERVLTEILKEQGFTFSFWHGKHGLRAVSDIETVLDKQGYSQNLNLSYGVRDGIICHSGGFTNKGLRPRDESIDLTSIQKSGQVPPFTWEGCIVKIADDIAYLGKDLEDAINNGFLHPDKLKALRKTIKEETGFDFEEINNTILIDHFITDLCANSNLETEVGLRFSEPTFKLMNIVKKFNYQNIYIPKGEIQDPNTKNIIRTIFERLDNYYNGAGTLSEFVHGQETDTLASKFSQWLVKYSNIAPEQRTTKKYANKMIYDINNPQDYKLSIIEYIASLTDKEAIKSFNEIVYFG